MNKPYDATIVGAGPNGLAAAITLAKAGYRVRVIEGNTRIGGGSRSSELTLPGFLHDVCAAIHPLGIASPFFRDLPLADFGLRWIQPPLPLAHPLDDGTAVELHRSVDRTAAGLGVDGRAYRRVYAPIVRDYQKILGDFLGPLRIPCYPLHFARFGLSAVQPATLFARANFKSTPARALFTGLAAHSILPLTRPATTAFGLMLGMLAHAVGWPLAHGGSQQFADAIGRYLTSIGGEIETGRFITDADEVLQDSRVVLLDVTPKQALKLAGGRLSEGYRRGLQRFRFGPGVFKIDYALDGPVPWRAEVCQQAGTVHVGGTMEEIVAAEAEVWAGRHPDRPFVLVGQLSCFDPTRAPEGKHTLWTYCHVPNDSTFDMTDRIEAQIERFAPGFRDRILARSTMNTADMERYNPNYVGGDINAGVQDLGQLFTRPMLKADPYATSDPRIFLCSSSTPPGGGVHGMCGYFSARSAIRNALQ